MEIERRKSLLSAGDLSDLWKALMDELDAMEKEAFESLLQGVPGDEVRIRVDTLRAIKAIPVRATDFLSRFKM